MFWPFFGFYVIRFIKTLILIVLGTWRYIKYLV